MLTVLTLVCNDNLLSGTPPVDDALSLTYKVHLLFEPSALTPGMVAELMSLTNDARVVPVVVTATLFMVNESFDNVVGLETVPWCVKLVVNQALEPTNIHAPVLSL